MRTPAGERRQIVSDEELLEQAKDDPHAFGVFYDRHYDHVVAFFARRIPNREAAFDLASETLAQALGGLRRFKPSQGNAGQWLYGIARHLLMRYWRTLRVDDRSRRRLGIDMITVDDETTALIDRIAADEALRQIQAILDALPPGQREAVRLRIIDELTYQEIAERVGCATGAARVRVHRGLKALRHDLERSWEEDQ